MAAQDIAAQVQDWVAGEIGRQCFGEDFGFAVTFGPAQVPNGQGGAVMVASWQLLMTTANPLLGQGDLYHLVPLGVTRPKEDQVRALVADGVRQLRDLARSQTAAGNGASSSGVPGRY